MVVLVKARNGRSERKNLPEDAWLCFHCHAGSGRTGALMTIWEMMQKPDAALEEILQHHADTGSTNMVARSTSDTQPGGGLTEGPELTRKRATQQRIIMVRAMYSYIQENYATNYAVTWSDWLAARSRIETLQVGQKLQGEGMSSDPLVVSDTLEALAPGQVVVFTGDTVLIITVK